MNMDAMLKDRDNLQQKYEQIKQDLGRAREQVRSIEEISLRTEGMLILINAQLAVEEKAQIPADSSAPEEAGAEA